MKTTAAPTTPPITNSAEEGSASARMSFIVLALNMSWQLLVVVLLPVLGGVWLDKHHGHGTTWTIGGLAVALVLSVAVIAQAARTASKFPVPKLSAAEKHAVQRQIAEDDADD